MWRNKNFPLGPLFGEENWRKGRNISTPCTADWKKEGKLGSFKASRSSNVRGKTTVTDVKMFPPLFSWECYVTNVTFFVQVLKVVKKVKRVIFADQAKNTWNIGERESGTLGRQSMKPSPWPSTSPWKSNRGIHVRGARVKGIGNVPGCQLKKCSNVNSRLMFHDSES